MIENFEWQDKALCTEVDPNLWHAPKGQYRMSQVAKLICSECIVRADCLDYGLRHPELGGILGGVGERERRQLRKAN